MKAFPPKQTLKKGSVKGTGTPASTAFESKHLLALGGVLLLTFLAYLPALNNGFVWDDVAYIKNNSLIRAFDLKAIFSSYVMGNYHPLTILVHAIEFHLFGMSPAGYHAVNIGLHVINTSLVFYALYLLCNRLEVALVAALIFGIHPLHVESVAWVSELKDVLYTLFFLVSYIFYLRNIKAPSIRFLSLSIFFFLCSLLSKGMAVTLPLVLLLTDYFIRKDFRLKTGGMNMKILFEKLPYLGLSLVFGIVSIMAQKSSGSISDISIFTLPQRIAFASYGFMTYIYKLALPLNLCAYYPYPIKSGGELPSIYFLYPAMVFALIALILYSVRYTKQVAFSFGFYTVTIFLVLQLLPVGSTIISERYGYLSSIGLLYLVGEGFYRLLKGNLKMPAMAALVVVSLFFSYKTYARCAVWKDGLALWKDVTIQFPNEPMAFFNYGTDLMNDYAEMETDPVKKKELFGKVIESLERAYSLDPASKLTYQNLASSYYSYGEYKKSIEMCNKVLELKPNLVAAHLYIGKSYYRLNEYAKAIEHLKIVIEQQKDVEETYIFIGGAYLMMNDFNNSIDAYKKAIELNPKNSNNTINLGSVYGRMGDYKNAMKWFRKCLEINPNDAQTYYYLSITSKSMNDKENEALYMEKYKALKGIK